MDGPLAIVGYMGSGKTTVGSILARKLGWEFVDLDYAIAKEVGREISEIFARSGEEHFRDLEHSALLTALDGEGERVVACGGGIVVRRENRDELKKHVTIFLQEDLDILYGRTRDPRLPLRAASLEEFERRFATRLPYYEEVADLVVPARGRQPEEVAMEITRWLLGA
ncbi:MAG TPA: shikimate kinase [Rubrobacteraceae bacterium]|nr:shikimate kinase [Rubrobacteraceae bacterium]